MEHRFSCEQTLLIIHEKTFFIPEIIYWRLLNNINMNQSTTIYLRLSNGKGQRVTIDSETTLDALLTEIQSMFSLQPENFSIVFQGKAIENENNVTLAKIGISQNCIIHIIEKTSTNKDNIRIKIFFEGKLYEYENSIWSKIIALKNQLFEKVQDSKEILLSFRAQKLKDQQTLHELNFRQNDVISAICYEKVPHEVRISSINPKITKSVTITTTGNNSKGFELAPKQYLRKSSMKSSQSSKQRKKEDVNSEQGRTKSESQINKQNQDHIQQSQSESKYILPVNKLWLFNQKFVETQSINCQDSYMDEPELWTECFLPVRVDNKFYKLECKENHGWEDVLNKISVILKANINNLIMKSEDTNLMQHKNKNWNPLKIAKFIGAQVLPQIQVIING